MSADERHIQCLVSLIKQIDKATQAADENELNPEEALPTAAELARLLGYKLDYLKKQLKLLRSAELIHALGMNPKRYRLDRYRLQELLEEEIDEPLLQAALQELVEPSWD